VPYRERAAALQAAVPMLAKVTEAQKLEEHYRTDRSRVESRLESAIARVKRGED